ncbi:hypothetical protein FH972_024315 [Carpinus fangiana]|uniref:Uncharacterized protein n=1 Tax=Carpinus fangiana TaxID=176857 RepID=A0A5N6KXP9_9ROSI|nr:hypothetical protein FH972_024315 [Carpinus fangiana]
MPREYIKNRCFRKYLLLSLTPYCEIRHRLGYSQAHVMAVEGAKSLFALLSLSRAQP